MGELYPMTKNPLDTQPTHEDGDVDVEANAQDLNTEVEKSGSKRSDRAKAKARRTTRTASLDPKTH